MTGGRLQNRLQQASKKAFILAKWKLVSPFSARQQKSLERANLQIRLPLVGCSSIVMLAAMN